MKQYRTTSEWWTDLDENGDRLDNIPDPVVPVEILEPGEASFQWQLVNTTAVSGRLFWTWEREVEPESEKRDSSFVQKILAAAADRVDEEVAMNIALGGTLRLDAAGSVKSKPFDLLMVGLCGWVFERTFPPGDAEEIASEIRARLRKAVLRDMTSEPQAETVQRALDCDPTLRAQLKAAHAEADLMRRKLEILDELREFQRMTR